MRRTGLRTTSTYHVDEPPDPDLPPRPPPRYPSERAFSMALAEAGFDEEALPPVPVVILRVPSWEAVLDVIHALRRRPFKGSLRRFGAVNPSERGDAMEGLQGQVEKLIADERPVLVVSHPGVDLGVIGRAADVEFHLRPLSWPAVQALATSLTGDEGAEFDAIAPWNVDEFGPEVWNLAYRPGMGSAPDLVSRLSTVAGTASLPPPPALTLEDCPGLGGEVDAWGRQLVDDLRDYRAGMLSWEDVDRGALLVGPPGVGKTRWAQALSGSCGAAFVSASGASWMATRESHMGGYIKAMRCDFRRASLLAPCILFVDELDAVGTRAHEGDQNAAWTAGIVTALLEELDGVGGREGVVVLAASNHERGIDPAILRSGRLDRVLHVGLPTVEALEAITRVHAGPDLRDADLSEVARQALGGTGADVARWCREARRLARRAGRRLEVDDLLQVVRPPERRERSIMGFRGP